MDIVNYQCNDFITEVNNMGNQRTQPSVTLLHAKLGWQWLIKTPVMATIVYNIVVLCKFRRIPILIVFSMSYQFYKLVAYEIIFDIHIYKHKYVYHIHKGRSPESIFWCFLADPCFDIARKENMPGVPRSARQIT